MLIPRRVYAGDDHSHSPRVHRNYGVVSECGKLNQSNRKKRRARMPVPPIQSTPKLESSVTYFTSDHTPCTTHARPRAFSTRATPRMISSPSAWNDRSILPNATKESKPPQSQSDKSDSREFTANHDLSMLSRTFVNRRKGICIPSSSDNQSALIHGDLTAPLPPLLQGGGPNSEEFARDSGCESVENSVEDDLRESFHRLQLNSFHGFDTPTSSFLDRDPVYSFESSKRFSTTLLSDNEYDQFPYTESCTIDEDIKRDKPINAPKHCAKVEIPKSRSVVNLNQSSMKYQERSLIDSLLQGSREDIISAVRSSRCDLLCDFFPLVAFILNEQRCISCLCDRILDDPDLRQSAKFLV